MKKYIITAIAATLAFNTQTFLFAKDSYEKKSANAAFEQFLPTKNFSAQDFKNLLSDNSFIALEKLFIAPAKKTTDNTATSQNNYYTIYQSVLANPSSSADFNFL